MNNKLVTQRHLIPLRYLLVVACFFLTILLYIDRAAISVAKQQISTDLNFSSEQFGWIMAVFTLGYALFQTPSGILVDKKGSRFVISAIVGIWSLLTAITGAAWNFSSMLVIRFLFGAGEAGAFPSLSKVVYSWFPLNERGTVQGIHFSGSRLGAAFGIPLVAILIEHLGWRHTFLAFGLMGIFFATAWYIFFRNTPEESSRISDSEKQFILAHRQQETSTKSPAIPFFTLIKSRFMQLMMVQYICSNFTFYFTLTWMFPFIQQKFQIDAIQAGFYSAIPLLAGFFGNIFSGVLIDSLYRKTHHHKTLGAASRRIPAVIGFALAAFGMVMVTLSTTPIMAVLFLAIAVFGADMTLSPSWTFCIDVGKKQAGSYSGTMNMAGNLGAFVTIIAYPYLLKWTGSQLPFFYLAAGLSVLAIVVWFFIDTDKQNANA
jgi:MFS transporter, ACS family, glucarate transporter